MVLPLVIIVIIIIIIITITITITKSRVLPTVLPMVVLSFFLRIKATRVESQWIVTTTNGTTTSTTNGNTTSTITGTTN